MLLFECRGRAASTRPVPPSAHIVPTQYPRVPLQVLLFEVEAAPVWTLLFVAADTDRRLSLSFDQFKLLLHAMHVAIPFERARCAPAALRARVRGDRTQRPP